MSAEILVGYEVKTGETVNIQPVHVGVAGITRETGKTTAIEAMIMRSGKTGLVFKTKLGEHEDVFREAVPVSMFYQARSDWQYVESLLEAATREDQRFNRSFIRKVCQGTRTLEQVWENVKKQLTRVKEESFLWSIYYNLDAYFEMTVPQLSKFSFTTQLRLAPKTLNLMDLEPIAKAVHDEETCIALQSLVIRATLEEVYRNNPGTVVVLPEASDFVPAARTITPVNHIAETIVRKGGVRDILLWLDTQRIADVHPRVRGQISTWLLGKQTYDHEVERSLKLIPLPRDKKPKPEDVQQLNLGHFYLVSRDQVKAIYVRPVWMSEVEAIRIATGEVKPPAPRPIIRHTAPALAIEKLVETTDIAQVRDEMLSRTEGLKHGISELANEIRGLQTGLFTSLETFKREYRRELEAQNLHGSDVIGSKTITHAQEEWLVRHMDKLSEFNTDNGIGQIMYVMVNDLEGNRASISQIGAAMLEYGWNPSENTLRLNLMKLVKKGCLLKEGTTASTVYRTPKKVKVTVKKQDPPKGIISDGEFER